MATLLEVNPMGPGDAPGQVTGAGDGPLIRNIQYNRARGMALGPRVYCMGPFRSVAVDRRCQLVIRVVAVWEGSRCPRRRAVWVAWGRWFAVAGFDVGCGFFSGRWWDAACGATVGFFARFGVGLGRWRGSCPVRASGFAVRVVGGDERGVGGGVAVESGAGGCCGWTAVSAPPATPMAAPAASGMGGWLCRRVRLGRCRRSGLMFRAHLSVRLRR